MHAPRPTRIRGAISPGLSVLVSVLLAALLTACAGDDVGDAGDVGDDAEDVTTETTDDGDAAPDLTEDEPAADTEDDPEVEEQAAAPDAATSAEDAAEPTEETAPALDPLQGLALETVADGFDGPIGVSSEPGSDRLVVIERTGRAWLVDPDAEVLADPLLDLSEEVTAASIEQGLLGLAFHPDWPADDRVFLYHSLPGNDNVLVTYRRDPTDPDRLDPGSRQVLLTVDKEPDKVRHNGGHVLFGPDGLLYVSVGDAARASVNGQDPSTLPGTILRIDVDGGDPYAIPSDNPFADGVEGAPEVWWYGLRNPWRFSIDTATGLAYVADVGQETVEEVNVVPLEEGGTNFGWPALEGSLPFYDTEPNGPVTAPVLEVLHDEQERGCSITGGVVSRGDAIPEVAGRYWYADWCHGWIRSFVWDGAAAGDLQDHSEELTVGNVASFGLDADGEVLIVDWAGGTVHRLIARR
ncbi:MAG: PQQ-dependent sugar dehydrogenase [Nitriliruptoraceae bacterium]